MKTIPDDNSTMQSYLTVRRVAGTFLGIVAYFCVSGMKAILEYREECAESPIASKLICNNRLFTMTLACLLFGFAGFLQGGQWDRERLKDPETRRRETERADQTRREIDAAFRDTSRLGSRCMWAILAAAAWHAFGPSDSRLQECIEDCPDGLWPASLMCYNSFVSCVGAYPFAGFLGFSAAVFWERNQGVVSKRRE
jgi:hypothetical protein